MKKRVFAIALATSLTMASMASAMEMEKEAGGGSKIHFHGYGELHYNNPETGALVPESKDPSVFDFHRTVLGWSYDFTDRVSLNTEIDFEHAAQELELEFSYLDIQLHPGVNLRAGAVLLPVGPLNEFHEPTLFPSVERAQIHTVILPTSWAEPGIGISGSPSPSLKYRLYLVNGLDSTAFDKGKGFTAEKGIREGRQFFKKNDPNADHLAGVGRLEYFGLHGLSLGGSLYSGSSVGGIDVQLLEVDLRHKIAQFDWQVVFAQSSLGGLPATSNVGTKQQGLMVEVRYNVSNFVPFFRYEAIDTQIAPPTGRDLANDRTIMAYGVAYYPIPDVAFKADMENWEDGKGTSESRTNLGVAYMF